MKTITKQITVLAVFGLISASAFSQANSYSVNSETLYRHGYNSGGANVQENTDSVTTGGTTRYWVYPDLSLNPGYDVNNPLTTPLTSSFTWGTTGVTGSASGVIAAVGAYGTYTNYKQVTWSGTGTINLNATERSGAGANCDGITITTPVAVIAAPDVTAITFSPLTCPTGTIPYTKPGPTATLTITCPVNGNKEVSVNWSLSCSNAGWNGGVAMTGTAVLGNGNTIDLSGVNLSHPGTYTLTIVNITDRIATKSGLTAIPDGTSNSFVLLPTPVTGPMYHVPNQ